MPSPREPAQTPVSEHRLIRVLEHFAQQGGEHAVFCHAGLMSSGDDPSKVVVVVNRFNAKERIPKEIMEEALGRPIQWSIPNDYLTVTRAVNQGTTVRLIDGKGPLAQNFDQLVTIHVLSRSNGNGDNGHRPSASSRSSGLRKKVGAWLRRRSHGTS